MIPNLTTEQRRENLEKAKAARQRRIFIPDHFLQIDGKRFLVGHHVGLILRKIKIFPVHWNGFG